MVFVSDTFRETCNLTHVFYAYVYEFYQPMLPWVFISFFCHCNQIFLQYFWYHGFFFPYLKTSYKVGYFSHISGFFIWYQVGLLIRSTIQLIGFNHILICIHRVIRAPFHSIKLDILFALVFRDLISVLIYGIKYHCTF